MPVSRLVHLRNRVRSECTKINFERGRPQDAFSTPGNYWNGDLYIITGTYRLTLCSLRTSKENMTPKRFTVYIAAFCGPTCLELVNLYFIYNRDVGSVAQSVGTPVFGRRIDPVLRSACSRLVTTMGKPSATGQPTTPTQPFIFPRSINE